MLVKLLKQVFRFSTIGPALTRFYIVPRVKLHRIHQSDADFHTHPWNGWSFILGFYDEYRDDQPLQRRWFFNRVFAFIPHKVLITRPVWTLFIHGPRINEHWKYGKDVRPWNGSDQERSVLDQASEAVRTIHPCYLAVNRASRAAQQAISEKTNSQVFSAVNIPYDIVARRSFVEIHEGLDLVCPCR